MASYGRNVGRRMVVALSNRSRMCVECHQSGSAIVVVTTAQLSLIETSALPIYHMFYRPTFVAVIINYKL